MRGLLADGTFLGFESIFPLQVLITKSGQKLSVADFDPSRTAIACHL